MRFIVMHKQDKDSEAGLPPSQELIAEMGKLIAEGTKNGIFLSGEGLHSSSKRVRLDFSGGTRIVTNGPFAGSNELVASLLMMTVKSKEEAIEWASRFAMVLGATEIELGQVKEPWDLGLCPRPEAAKLRFLALHKADKKSESGVARSAKQIAAMRKLTDEMVKAGVFLTAEQLRPSSKGARLTVSGGKRSSIDGPFTESKELIGGFAMQEVRSREDAIEWASRFATVLGDARVDGNVEVDIYQLYQKFDKQGARS
jgi:hypothetical protein